MTPIFIGGCERSGTTLLGAMLGVPASYLCVPEMQFKFDILQWAANSDTNRLDTSETLKRLTRRARFRLWELELSEASSSQPSLSGREMIEWLVRQYGQQVEKTLPMVWIDHTPKNIRHTQTLFTAFPDARMVHIVRDGRAVAASVLPLDWGPNVIESAARFWAERLAYGLAAELRWPERVVRVRYEDLVQAPEATLRELCGHLSISYDPTMRQGTGFHTPRYTAKQHMLVGKAPDPARIHGWQQQLTARQIEIFENVTTDLLEMLGYTPQFGVSAKKVTWKESFVGSVQELYKKEFVNRRRKRQRKAATIPG